MDKIFAVCVDPGKYNITRGKIYLVWDDPDPEDYDHVLYEHKDDSNKLTQNYKCRFIPVSELINE